MPLILDIPIGDSQDGIDVAMLLTLKTTRKTGGLQILRCQGIAVENYSFTLDAWALKPSGFCNVGVKTGNETATRF
jgi:hypothetical protein